MHLHSFFFPAALFISIVHSLPLDSADEGFFLSDSIAPDFSSESTAGFNVFDDVNSFPLTFNDAEIPNSDLFASSSSEDLIPSANLIDSDPNSLLQVPDDEEGPLFNSDSIASNSLSEPIIGPDVLEGSQNWLEPSFTLAENPSVSPANGLSASYNVPVCCGRGESLILICMTCEFVNILPWTINSTYIR